MTATLPPRYGLRECRLYRFYVTDPLTGETVLGYIGETGRQPFERLLEHLATQPWFDTVVRWEIDGQVFYGKDAVLRAETAAIRDEKPLYNVKGNEQNRARIIPPDAIRQRRARDAAKDANRWVHPDDRAGVVAAPRVKARPKRRRWKPWQRTLLAWTIAWLVLATAGWITFTALHWGGWKQTGISAAVVTSALLGWLRWSKPGRKIRRFFR